MPSILYERRDQIAIIRLNRPAQRNALSLEMIAALSDHFGNLHTQPNLRVVILTGVGAAFCAGSDLTEPDSLNEPGARESSERCATLYDEIESCGVPVIAAVNGFAAGAGCELAFACHLKIVSATAQFALTETRLSFTETKSGPLPAAARSDRLARELGDAQARELLSSGKAVSPDEALRLGLVNRVVPAAELMSHAAALAQEIVPLAPLAIRACLEAVIKGTQLPLAEGLALETKLFAGLFATDDVGEGTSAFLEKRIPVFKGT
jgi:enoyl-CoA hydratase